MVNELMENRKRILMNTPHKAEASGEIATFRTDMGAKLKTLTAQFAPVQDLHGYDAPWPAGGGKNKWNGSIGYWATANGNWTTSGTAQTYQSSQKIKANPGDKFFLTVDKTISARYVVFWKEGAFVRGVSGATLTPLEIPSDADEFAIDLRFADNATALAAKVSLAVGDSEELWTPYSNICPITGWDAVTVYRAGKNLINAQGGTITGSGTREVSFSFTAPKDGDYVLSFDVNDSTTYSLNASYNLSDGRTHYQIWTSSGPPMPPVNGRKTIDFPSCVAGTIYTTTLSVSASVGDNGCTIENIQMERGTTATEYEEYRTESYPISLGATRYGGTLDVKSGILTVDKAAVDMGSISWTLASAGYFNIQKPNVGMKAVNDAYLICSAYPTTQNIGTSPSIYDTTNALRVYDPQFATAADFKVAMTGQTVVFEVAEPLTYQLTPVQVRSLIGTNNVWADSGDCDVTFWTH